jgi:hypothetical protein
MTVPIRLLLGCVAIFTVLPMLGVLAFTDAEDIAECERRNLFYGCDCDCRGEDLVCTEDDQNCNYRLGTSSAGRPFTVLGLEPFPSLGTDGGVVIVDSSGNLQVGATLASIFKWVFWIIGLIAIAMGLYGGFTFSTAGGDEEKPKTASKILKNALIGFVIAIAGLLIVVTLSSILGFNEGNIDVDKAVENKETNKTKDDQDQQDFIDNLFE